MITGIVLIFILGYVCIALEHKIKIDKAAFALLMCGIIWTVLSIFSGDADIEGELVSYLGDTCETLIFLIGAMTIVDLIDMHGGFSIITDHITTREKRRLMWLLAFITFFMSAVLDNMTTTIIMVMVLRRLISDRHERWIFTGVIVIAANSGGAWSPHRRRHDNHALDARQRHGRSPVGLSAAAVSCVAHNTYGVRLAYGQGPCDACGRCGGGGCAPPRASGRVSAAACL